ncbi:hypothetical protein REPUB_Repub18cG0025700 [Reevesia pubescens]
MKVSTGTVVWVTNREAHVFDPSGVLSFTNKGILRILNSQNRVVWSSNTSQTAQNPILELLESGNLVVKDRNDNNPHNFLCQSFDYPCDNFLPGMKVGNNFSTGFERSISSWKSTDDPAQGQYSFRIDPHGYLQLVVDKGFEVVFRARSWDGIYFSNRKPNAKPSALYSYQFVLNKDEVYFKVELQNSLVILRYAMNPSGLMQRFIWNERKQD